jgi:hypothetical protein
MGREESDKNDVATEMIDSTDRKIDKILTVVTAIIVIGTVSWFFFNSINGWMTEGNPNLSLDEVNETVVSAHQISHLTEQEYNDFPKLREMVENHQATKWSGGYRYLRTTKISEQQRGFIVRKYAHETNYNGYLEYQGKYYLFEITLS